MNPLRRFATAILLALAVYAAVTSIYRASRRFLWFDELVSMTVAKESRSVGIWSTLEAGFDGNPPPFYEVEALASRLTDDPHVAYRLPSIFAFLGIPIGLFIFVSRRAGDTAGLTAAMVPFVTPLFRYYAVEARPYAMTNCCIALALVVWQDVGRSWLRASVLGLLLAAATSFHYYALFALMPFAAAELWRWLRTRELRVAVWLAFALGVAPFLLFWPLLWSIKQALGSNFWGQANLLNLFNGILGLPDFWSTSIAALLGVAMLAGAIDDTTRLPSPHRILPEERLLAAGFVALPIVAYLITRMLHGAMIGRYVLPSALGVSIALGFAVSGNRKLVNATLALLVSVFLFQQLESWRFGRAEAVASREYPDLALLRDMNESSTRATLPTVVSHGLTFMAMAYYGATHTGSPSFVYVADRDNALRFVGTDSVDRTLLTIQPYAHLPVEKLSEFLTRHDRFLVYSTNDPTWEWLIPQQLADGASVRVMTMSGGHTLYLVERANLANQSH
jgi:4-amino-4-deoxy-L-arabinose transferase-like glycosyltransferase